MIDPKEFMKDFQITENSKNNDLNFQENINKQELSQDSQNNINELPKTSENIDKVSEALFVLNEELEIEETTVELPALKTSVAVTPITSEDEILLNTNRLNIYQFSKKLNSIILNHIKLELIEKDEYKVLFSNLNRFENEILPIDRSLLIYGLSLISFEKFTEFENICDQCEKNYIADFDLKNTFFNFDIDSNELQNKNFYDILDKQVILNGLLEFDLGFNTEKIRLELLKKTDDEQVRQNLEKRNLLFDVLDNLLLYVKNIKVYKHDKRVKNGLKLVVEFNVEKEFEKTREFLQKLPMKVKEAILSEINIENITKYLPNFYVNITCPYCGYTEKMPFSPEIEFFRKAASLSGGQ